MWEAIFTKDKDKEKVGSGVAHWMVNDVILFTYQRRINGVDDAQSFKDECIAAKAEWESETTKNAQLSTQLTNFLNA